MDPAKNPVIPARGGDSKQMKGTQSIGPTDEDLVRRFQRDPSGTEGQAAAAELFERYWKPVYLWCLRRAGVHETARDIAQEVLVDAYRALAKFEGRSTYSTWLFTIMRNRCFRALRRGGLTLDDQIEIDGLADDAKQIDLRLLEDEDEQEILDLIRKILDSREQSALWLRVFEHMPVDEITRRLGIQGSSGARGILQSARRKLRDSSGLRERLRKRTSG